ncbi:hypothetical protein HDU97_007100, partial [Phlyctochytrium planicorne]
NCRFTFDIVVDPNVRDVMARRELVWERRGTMLSRNKKYLMHCGQPTNAESGYAVNLRLCGDFLCWISVKTLAVCNSSGPPPRVRHLVGHTQPLVCLATNSVNLVATAAEDLTIRVWDLKKMKCIWKVEEVDALDLAMECDAGKSGGSCLACFNNNDEVIVWDVLQGEMRMRLDLRRLAVAEGGIGGVQFDLDILSREVKIHMSRWAIVCGFENTWFLTINRASHQVMHCLHEESEVIGLGEEDIVNGEPMHNDQIFSNVGGIPSRGNHEAASYPTVLGMYEYFLFTRGRKSHEVTWVLSI